MKMILDKYFFFQLKSIGSKFKLFQKVKKLSVSNKARLEN